MAKHYNDWPNDAGFTYSQDYRSPIELEITGSIPDYARGVLYGTGPGGYTVQGKDGYIAISHWFDGHATTHRFEIMKDKVLYSSYNQVDDLITNTAKAGCREDITFGQRKDPCESIFHKIRCMFTPEQSDNPREANINVSLRETFPAERLCIKADTVHPTSSEAGAIHSLTVTTDTAKVKHFDPDTLHLLSVTAQTVLHPDLIGPLSATHSAYDGDEYFNYNLSLGIPTYRIWKSNSKTGETTILATLYEAAAYIHSMFLTKNYVILSIYPARLRYGGLSVLWTYNMMDTIKWQPDAPVIWLVVSRRGGLVRKYTSPAFFAFHTVNAFEQDNDIICDVVEHKNIDMMEWFYYENLVSSEKNTQSWNEQNRTKLAGGLSRYRLKGVYTTSCIGTAERIFHIAMPSSGELPHIHPDYKMRPHRYVWSILDRRWSSLFDGLGKTDIVTGDFISWERLKHTPGEPIFVAKPGGEEDEGVILSVVLNGETGKSYLLCLDSKTMQELAVVHMDHPVGHGFHGLFVKK